LLSRLLSSPVKQAVVVEPSTSSMQTAANVFCAEYVVMIVFQQTQVLHIASLLA